MRLTKKRKQANGKVDRTKLYSIDEAAALLKEISTPRFDASVDLHVRLGVDPRKPDQAIRSTVTLPHGTGKSKRVLVLCSSDKEDEARAAGAEQSLCFCVLLVALVVSLRLVKQSRLLL